jgi:hypothetical protein
VFSERTFNLQLQEFWKQNECMERQESVKRFELLLKASGKVNMQAQAGIKTELGAFVFVNPFLNKIWIKFLPHLPLPSKKTKE